MIARTWQVGGDPLPIFNAPCDLVHKFADHFLDRGHLVFVEIRHLSGNITVDGDGFLPHLQYKPDYVKTESDRGEYTLTGNTDTKPVWRFDPAPFFASVAGSIVLTGGRGDAIFDVAVVIKRFAKLKPLRHTLTIGTTANRFVKPFGCSGLWIPDQLDSVDLQLGVLSHTIQQPNGGFVAFGPFDVAQFDAGTVVTLEMTLPM